MLLEKFIPILNELKRRGIDNSWLVGGVVRDLLMGREPTDIDIVCDEGTTESLISKVGGTLVGKPPFCTVSTHLLDYPIEIGILTGKSIHEDLELRDFTMNAIAIDIEGNIFDPFGGVRDIQNCGIRLVPATTLPYEADPVRVVRALRFAHILNFSIEFETAVVTARFIKEHPDKLTNIPNERYGKELLKGFSSRPYDFLTVLEYYSLLPIVLPEIELMRAIEQPAIFHPEGCVLTHTFRVMNEVQGLNINNIILTLAALFHDVGKPHTIRKHPKYERDCFYKHDLVGSRIALEVLNTWAIPNYINSAVSSLVRYHMFHMGRITKRTCVKLLRKFGNTLEESLPLAELLFDLAFSDARGAMDTGEKILVARERLYEVHDNLFQVKTSSNNRLLSGKEIMHILGIPPGREVGRILEEIDVAVSAGKFSNKNEVEEWLKNGMVEYSGR